MSKLVAGLAHPICRGAMTGKAGAMVTQASSPASFGTVPAPGRDAADTRCRDGCATFWFVSPDVGSSPAARETKRAWPFSHAL